MVILISVCAVLFACGCAYFYHKLKKEKQAKAILKAELEEEIKNLIAKQIDDRDLKFLEFAVDMYVKYAKDLNIYSDSQHEYIVNELERIRQQHLDK